MVVIPAGNFMMGSADNDDAKYKGEEQPQHAVQIKKSFALGIYHITRGDFAKFVRVTGYKVIPGCNVFDGGGKFGFTDDPTRSWRDPGFTQTDRDPAMCISWDDAQAYIKWLNEQYQHATHKKDSPYRLPTEAEWEYAARAGTTTRYFWGNERGDACKYANAADLSGKRANPKWVVPDCDDGYAATSPVGSFKPNPFGLYDIVGNAWQWTQDCWQDNYNGEPTDGSALILPKCDVHTSRGGSWRYDPNRGLRSASRGQDQAASHWASVGFRVARTLN